MLLRWGLKILDHAPDATFEAHLRRCLGEHDLAQWSPKVAWARPCTITDHDMTSQAINQPTYACRPHILGTVLVTNHVFGAKQPQPLQCELHS